MITYALVDPRNKTPRYIGVTRNPKQRLSRHLSDGYWAPGFYPEENWKDGWVGVLRALGLKPLLVKLADGNSEREFYDALGGKQLLNKHRPHRRLQLPFYERNPQ